MVQVSVDESRSVHMNTDEHRCLEDILHNFVGLTNKDRVLVYFMDRMSFTECARVSMDVNDFE